MILPLAVAASHLLYGSRNETSNECSAVLRLTILTSDMVRGLQFSTKTRKICPFLVAQSRCYPLGRIRIVTT